MKFIPQTFLNPLKEKISQVFNAHQPQPKPDPTQAEPTQAEQLNAVAHFLIPPTPEPPAGCVKLRNGNFKLESELEDNERKRETLLQPLAQEGIELWLELCHYKKKFDDAFDQIEEINQPKKTKRALAGKMVNLELFLLDGSIRFTRRRADIVRYEEDAMLEAWNIIDSCVERWSVGGDNKIRMLAESAFTKNAQGEYSRSGMLKLRRLPIDDKEWKEAMDKIAKAEVPDGSTSYILISVRDVHGKYHPLPLDISDVRPIVYAKLKGFIEDDFKKMAEMMGINPST